MSETTTSETTTIKVFKETRDALKTIGQMGDSYDDVIRRLMYIYQRAENDEPEDFGVWIREYLEEAKG